MASQMCAQTATADIHTEKLNAEVPCNPTVPPLRTHSQNPKSTHHKDTCTSIVIVTLVTITRNRTRLNGHPQMTA